MTEPYTSTDIIVMYININSIPHKFSYSVLTGLTTYKFSFFMQHYVISMHFSYFHYINYL